MNPTAVMEKMMSKGIYILTVGLLAGLAQPAISQTYPSQPVKLLVSSAPGSGTEVLARAFADELSKVLSQPVVPENKTGGANTVAVAILGSSKPDGYTLGFTSAGPFVTIPHLQDVPYKVQGFEFICKVFELPVVFAVKQDSPYKTLKDVVTAAASAPEKITLGTAGVATIPHIALAEIEEKSGAKIKHTPYRGDAPALQAVLGGEVTMGGLSLGTISGQPVRPLAIFSRNRIEALPDVPTAAENGFPIFKAGLAGLIAPKGLPPQVKQTLEGACQKAASADGFKTLASRLNQPVTYLPGSEWEKEIAADSAANKAVIDRLGLKAK